MKKIIQNITLIVITGWVNFAACKKENSVVPVITSSPPVAQGNATINFHIKNVNGNPGYPVYLYRMVVDSLSSSYTGGRDIYLRPNIDTMFNYQLFGNTNNLFIVGSTIDDNIIIYQELRYIVAGSSVNWSLEY
jgi:hypothetical protein